MFSGRWLAAQTVAIYVLLVAFTFTFEKPSAQAASGFERPNLTQFKPRKSKGAGRSISRNKATYQKIDRTSDGYRLEYGFKNFNGDALTMRAELDAAVVAESIKEFGFRKKDFDDLDAWYKKARKLASEQTNKFLKAQKFTSQKAADVASRQAQKSLDRELDLLAKAYRKRRVQIYEKAGFRLKEKGVVEADVAGMVRRNWKRLRPLAKSFNGIASERRYKQEDLIGAVTAMVQTSMRYEIPDKDEGTRTIGGILPPMKALILGQGDCDTKTGVIASILSNWPNIKMVGLGIPGHYLMAFHQIPRRGDVFIEYKGLQYVMIESAGPAWLRPGVVGDSTMAYLKGGNNFRIQPL